MAVQMPFFGGTDNGGLRTQPFAMVESLENRRLLSGTIAADQTTGQGDGGSAVAQQNGGQADVVGVYRGQVRVTKGVDEGTTDGHDGGASVQRRVVLRVRDEEEGGLLTGSMLIRTLTTSEGGQTGDLGDEGVRYSVTGTRVGESVVFVFGGEADGDTGNGNGDTGNGGDGGNGDGGTTISDIIGDDTGENGNGGNGNGDGTDGGNGQGAEATDQAAMSPGNILGTIRSSGAVIDGTFAQQFNSPLRGDITLVRREATGGGGTNGGGGGGTTEGGGDTTGNEGGASGSGDTGNDGASGGTNDTVDGGTSGSSDSGGGGDTSSGGGSSADGNGRGDTLVVDRGVFGENTNGGLFNSTRAISLFNR